MPRNPSFSHPPKIPPTNSTQKSALNPEKQKLASKVRGQMQIHQIFQAHLGETVLLLTNNKTTKFCIVTSAITWLTRCFFVCSFSVSLEFGYILLRCFGGYCIDVKTHVFQKLTNAIDEDGEKKPDFDAFLKSLSDKKRKKIME